MKMMRTEFIGAIALGFVLISARSGHGKDELMTTFYAVSDSSFGVEAIAPAQMIRELAICKAVWFAEKKGARQMSLGNPSYDAPPVQNPLHTKVPEGWAVLHATAYLNGANPDGNPTFSIAEKSAWCRQIWPWYR